MPPLPRFVRPTRLQPLVVTLWLGIACLRGASVLSAATPPLWPANGADTWSARDALGRQVVEAGEAPPPRAGRYVGIFYFIWLGAHGYDRNKASPDESVRPPTPADTVSPYDISRLRAANSAHPEYGPPGAFHHWGEPYFGYYVSNDRWVIRRHAQMLADAAVDVVFFDVTNGRAYLPTVLVIAEEFAALRAQGRSTPSLSFLLHSATPKVAGRLFTDFFQKGLYRDLWFRWKGKPLILANPTELTWEQRDFFSVRESWAWTREKRGAWFGDGRDKWPWIDTTPQSFGWHESPTRPEQVAVAVASHPIANLGRSHQAGRQPPRDQQRPELGLYFSEQWERARAVDPEIVFVTGWNEWVAQRFIDGRAKNMLGKPIQKGDTFFVDAYDEEFSRDIEPMRGGFTDNYYLQLVSEIRRYKGARPAPVSTRFASIRIDGRFDDWKGAGTGYTDDPGDVSARDHHGWGRFAQYQNHSGRHDLIAARAACDANNLFFCLEVSGPLPGDRLPAGLTLWLRTPTRFFVVNRTGTDALLEGQTVAGSWETLGSVQVRVQGNRLELAVPRSKLNLEQPALDLEFKWADQCDLAADPMNAYDQGDTAPNSRFYYRFRHQP
ncbi:MAG: hypothetical protein JNJ82_21460 [Opitutaceae bacterium]|nr:hypothetical protein [Opitutaceae bacterium]